MYFNAFWLSKTEHNHSSEKLNVIYSKRFLFYAMSNYNLNTGELEDVEKLVEQTVQTLKSS